MNFNEFLISKGWRRYTEEWVKVGNERMMLFTEDYENYYVSTYGPLTYTWKHDSYYFNIYWGLHIVGHSPKFFILNAETEYFETTEEGYNKIIEEKNHPVIRCKYLK